MPQASDLDRADRLGCDWEPGALSFPGVTVGMAALVAALIAGLVLLAGRIAPAPRPPPAVTVQLMDSAAALLEPAMPAVAAPAVTEARAPMSDDLVPEPVIPASVAPLPTIEPSLATPLSPPPAVSSIPMAPPVSKPRPPALLRRQPRSTPARPAAQPASLASEPAEAPERFLPPVAIARPPISPPISTPVTAPADVSSGLGSYGAGLHRQIERNMLADRRVTQLGVSGTAMIEATIASDGRIVAARLARSSGVRGIDDAALGAVQRGGFPPFGPHMPAGPITVTVPIAVTAD